jgi:hybrid cluster-associated redox disulfide protein
MVTQDKVFIRRTPMQVNKDMLIGELLQIDINIAQLLMGAGMHCVGCPSSQGETLEEACMVHGISVDKLVAVINEYLEKKDA